MHTKLRTRVLRNLKPAIEEAERLYDDIRDADPTLPDRAEALQRLGKIAHQIVVCSALISDDIAERP